MLSQMNTFGSTLFRTLNTTAVVVENAVNAAEKQTRRLDILSAQALEAEQAQLEQSRMLALQKKQISNARLQKDLEREMQALGIKLPELPVA